MINQLELKDSLIIEQALQILDRQMKSKGIELTSPQHIRQFLRLELERYEHEVFCVMFLDQKHRVIKFEHMFTGTIDGASVYPREVCKKALEYNAAAVVFAHNHPSGAAIESGADERITKRLKDALNMLDIRTLDHFIVGHGEITSFAEKGLI